MVKAKDAWWYKFNRRDFSWEQFNGLLLLHEGAGTGLRADIVAQASAQQLFVGGFNEPYCVDQYKCFYDVFRFWASYSQSARNLGEAFANIDDITKYRGYGGFVDTALSWNGNESDITQKLIRAQQLGEHMLHPRIIMGDENTGPSNWGNVKQEWVNRLRTKNLEEGRIISTLNDEVFYYYDNFVVYSVNQYNYWKSVINIEMLEL